MAAAPLAPAIAQPADPAQAGQPQTLDAFLADRAQPPSGPADPLATPEIAAEPASAVMSAGGDPAAMAAEPAAPPAEQPQSLDSFLAETRTPATATLPDENVMPPPDLVGPLDGALPWPPLVTPEDAAKPALALEAAEDEAASDAAAAGASATGAAPAQPPAKSAIVSEVADWIAATHDNRGLPYVILDKVGARMFVFNRRGVLKGSAPVLVGSALGDDSTPGVGDREMSNIKPSERTTPAGRFLAGFGPGWGGKKVIWVDYKAAIALHPVVTAHPKERRPQRLASPTPGDNRISYGCINVSAAFYKKVVQPVFAKTYAIVYILPDTKPLDVVFPAMRLYEAALASEPLEAQAQAAPAPETRVATPRRKAAEQTAAR